jgi:hypothetical protein
MQVIRFDHQFDPLPAARRAVQQARRGVSVTFDDGEVGDLEREALVEGLPLWRAARAGHLYLAANASWPGLYKLGCTRRTVQTRIAELGGAGMATPWLIVFSWSVYDAHGLEARAHRACASWHRHGELFAGPFCALRAAVDAAIAEDRTLLERHVGVSFAPGALDAWLGEVACEAH